MMKKYLDFINKSIHTCFKVIAVMILLVNLFSSQFQLPAKAAGTNCISSSPPGGAYTVTPCFTGPTDGAKVSGNQTVSVMATVVGINPGISDLTFYLNGQYLITDFQSPYTFILPTNKWVDGNQVLAVAVTMKDGFISQRSSITLTFNNGITTPPVNNNTFTPTSGTTPQPGQPLVLAADGDGAGGETNATNVTNLIASWNPNLFLYLGDVYDDGSSTEFLNWYGSTSTFYGRFRSITDPVVGNHEYTNGAAPGYFDYWNNIPSYYSFDAAGWHFIALNSNCGLLHICAVGQAEYQWLQNDLNSHTNICTIAYYHHPVFNIGQEGYTPTMNDIWALMAQHGVDIVLNGHEHDYQRWVPLDGSGAPSSTGITELIAGGGGHGTTPFITTDSRMAVGFTASPSTFGALRLQLNQSGASFQYINDLGTILDSGVIPCSGAPADTTAPTAPANLTTTASPSNVNLTWNTSTDNVGISGYDIYRNGSLLTSVGQVTTYSDTNVTLGATYQYQVKARDGVGNISSFSNTAAVTIQSLLFSDGFESGNLSAWTTVTNLAVQQQDVYSGAFGARATSSGSAASYASKSLTTSQSDLYYNLRFKILSQGSTSVYLQRFRTSSNGAIAGVLVSSTGKLAYHNDVASPATTTTSTLVVTKNVWHQLETHLKINGALSQVEVWYDGARITALSRTDNFGTSPIGRIHVGDLQSTDVYNVAFDEVGANASFIDTGGIPTPTPTSTPSPTPTPGASLPFSDGFESGNLSAWTAVTNLVVQQQDVFSGAFAARATSSGSAASYASKTLSTSLSDLYYNSHFKLVSQGNTSAYLQNFRTSTNGPIVAVFVSNTGKLSYHNDFAPATTASTIVVSQNVWHQLQTHVHINSTSSQIEVWYDGAPVTALSKTDNFGTTLIGRIHLGDNQTSHIYNIDFDEVEVNNSFIGSISTPTPTPTPSNTLSVTNTSTPGATNTPTPTKTNTPTPGATNTSTATPTSTSASSSLIFNPVADSYVDSSNPAANFGTSTALRVDGSPVVSSYLRFTVQGSSGGSISHVRLLIYANSASSIGISALTVADNTWGEKTITFSNAPPTGNTLVTSPAVATGTWITLDVTSYVTGEGTFSFGVSTTGGTAISLASRESGAHSPQLIVDLQ
jgi:hypothetical protein